MYKNADWERIGQEVSQAIQEPPTIEQLQTSEGLDRESDRFMQAILTTIDQHTQRAKPSPVITLRRRFEDVEEAKANHQAAKQRYFQEIQKQKKTHWKDFLEDPNNIWKANAYTKLANTGTTIPTLTKGKSVAVNDDDKAKMLMETFFPVPPNPIRPTRQESGQSTESFQAPPTAPEIGLTEIEFAIWSSSPEKAAGEDEITFTGVYSSAASTAELAYGKDRSSTQTWKTGLHSTKSIQTDITPTDH
ncbi:hypothetical protein KCU93_g10252, partial [Aureobasidium melanogenum]